MKGFEPMSEQYGFPDMTPLLRREAEEYGSPGAYVDMLCVRFDGTPVYTFWSDLAMFIEPADPALDQESEHQASEAFYRGLVLPARIAQEWGGDQYIKTFARTPVAPDPREASPAAKDVPRPQVIHAIGAAILNVGHDSLQMIPASYQKLIEEWEDRLCPEVALQSFFRPGFGMGMHCVRFALQAGRSELQAIVETVGQGEFDWDAAAQELYGPGR